MHNLDKQRRSKEAGNREKRFITQRPRLEVIQEVIYCYSTFNKVCYKMSRYLSAALWKIKNLTRPHCAITYLEIFALMIHFEIIFREKTLLTFSFSFFPATLFVSFLSGSIISHHCVCFRRKCTYRETLT